MKPLKKIVDLCSEHIKISTRKKVQLYTEKEYQKNSECHSQNTKEGTAKTKQELTCLLSPKVLEKGKVASGSSEMITKIHVHSDNCLQNMDG